MITSLLASLLLALPAQGLSPGGQNPGARDDTAEQPAPPRPILSMRLEEGRAKSLNNWYKESDNWTLQGIVLTSYGPLWHPIGAKSLVAALSSKRPELQAFALEALLATDAAHMPVVMTPELFNVLTKKGLSYKHDFLKQKVVEVFQHALPDVQVEKPAEYKRWWKSNKKTYVPAAWTLPAPPDEMPAEESTGASFLKRALDLNSAGLEMAIVIDTTGSMQETIDAAAIALSEITEIMEGIAPKFKVGLAEYKDYEEFIKGGQILNKITEKADRVRSRLGQLVAEGGGDFPEAVLGGLKVALDERMGWERSANKVIIVIGDAPAHPKNQEALIKLATEANKSPFGVDAADIIDVDNGDGRSKSKRGVRPFIISAIGVGPEGVHGQTRESLRALSTAGGGSYAEVHTAKAGSPGAVSAKIVKHVLTLAFGSRWRGQMDDFMTIYMDYRAEGCFE